MCIAETNSLYSMKRIALLLTAIALTCASANAQSFLEKLGNRAKNAVERNLGNKVEKAVNDALDGNKNFLRDRVRRVVPPIDKDNAQRQKRGYKNPWVGDAGCEIVRDTHFLKRKRV